MKERGGEIRGERLGERKMREGRTRRESMRNASGEEQRGVKYDEGGARRDEKKRELWKGKRKR